jgi:hypothetical protein
VRRGLGACALAALAALLLVPAGASAAKPPFVYVVVIDGLDGDAVEAGSAPFISSLIAGEDANATYFPGSRSVMPAVTNANHVAMMSGAFAGRSGISGNAFALYAPLESGDSCARTGPLDLTAMPTQTSGENLNCPRAEFTFEAIQRQAGRRRPATAAIMGKPKLGNIFAGRNVSPARRDVDHLWAPCSSSPDDDEYCESVATNPITGYAATDAIVMDEVVRTVEDGVMARGRLRRPRLTFVNLPQVDSAGHAGGRESPLYTGAIGLADDEIERLVTTLKSEGIWKRSVLITLSDHSMDTTLSKVSMVSAFDGVGIPASAYLAVDGDNGSAEHVYLANRRSPDRHALLKQMRDAALATEGVGGAYYRRPNPIDGGRQRTLDAQQRGWRLAGRRTGDLFLTADPGSAFADPDLGSNPIPGNHGAPQTTDNFMAISGGGPLVRQGTVAGDGRRRNPFNADIAPTVMALLGLREPADSQGRVMEPAFSRSRLRRLGR